jgi:hypothetical protein
MPGFFFLLVSKIHKKKDKLKEELLSKKESGLFDLGNSHCIYV